MTPAPPDKRPPRIVAIVQARMGSTRLPGKVLKPIAGKPLLWYIVHRLEKSKLIEDVAIATTTNPLDEAIVAFGRAHGVTVIRGPEENVLARFALAAEATDADVIVRVSSDAPFLDGGFIDHLLAAMLEQHGDYVLLEDGAETAHEGVDPFTRRALDKLMMDAAHDPIAREHVTGYFKLHPGFVRIARAPAYPALAKAAGRLTIDTPDDLAFIEAIHERIAGKAGEASLADILLMLEREPSLRAINGHVQQKALASGGGGLALIRCDGGGAFGFGHVMRMTALARALRDREGIGSVFVVNGTEDACEPMRRAGFAASNDQSLEAAILKHRPDMLVLDGREGPSRAQLARLTGRVALTAVIDDGADRRLAADVAYYPPVPQAKALDWSGSHCIPRIGWEWALLGAPQNAVMASRREGSKPVVLVTMGGSDPFGLTLRCAQALALYLGDFRARFVIGPGFDHPRQMARRIVALHPSFETIEGARDLTAEFASADIALTAFGVTAYELAASGVPAIYLCLTQDHALSASSFEKASMGLSLGVAETVSDETIAGSVVELLEDRASRHAMRAAGLMTIDGLGPERVAADLAKLLSERRAERTTAAG